MLDAAREAIFLAQNRTRSNLDNDRMLTLSLVKYVEIIGEAASRITTQRQNELPQIPWAQIIGMRNTLIHGYYDIKLDLVWDTIT